MTQLTITLPDEVAQQAEAYARETGRSLENILETYLENVVKARTKLPPLSPRVQALLGALQLPEGMTYEQAKDEYLTNKYLK
ncbi:DUF6364 family protein [Hymenobacter sp.]|jgi:hypothetical protein|uniref:DUF6364 family protein n=1 Tax=Hymenobacter sp. TaxID=1898978 RepID=UPI002EDA0CB8